MNLWTDGKGALVWDFDQYVDSEGTHTRESDKSKIKSLFPVVKTDQPTDPTLKILYFTVEGENGIYKQVWQTAPKTNDDIRADIEQQIANLEKLQTKRRERDAIGGKDNGWLSNLEGQIEALRKTFPPQT